MIYKDGPVSYFQIILQAARTQQEASGSSVLSGNRQADRQVAKALDAMTITKLPGLPDGPAYTAIKECIQSAIDRADCTALKDYLTTSSTLRAIQALNGDERARLATILFKETDCLLAYQAFTTEAGMHLATGPTSDQLMVAKTASLVLEYKKQRTALALKECDTSTPLYSLLFLQMFRINQASHIPSQLINVHTDPLMGLSNRHYYGINRESQPTRHVSRQCPLCKVHQTDQKEHDRIFHPHGVETGPAALVYSEKLLTLVDKADFPDDIKARLLPPALFSLFGLQAIDFFALSESARIFPELFLSQQLCHYIDEQQALGRYLCQDYYGYNIPDPDKKKLAFNCLRTMMFFTTTIPVLAQVGCEIKATLDRRNVAIPKDAISDRYSVKKFAIPIPHEHLVEEVEGRIIPYLLARAVARENKVHPYLAGSRSDPGEDFFTRKDIDGVLKEAMNTVCARSGSDLRTGSGPTYIGYIPSEVATGPAGDNGFLDSNWSRNFLHGKYSHALALTCLACLNGLDRCTLKTIVDNGLWTPILDSNPYVVDVRFDPDHPSWIELNLKPAVEDMANSPFKFQQLLTTGELSASLRDIKRVILLHDEAGQSGLLAQLGKRMAMNEPLTLDGLTQITEHIDVLEKVVATKHLNSMRQVMTCASWRTPDSEALYNPEERPYYSPKNRTLMGNFPTSEILVRTKARRCLAKGQRVQGIGKNEQGNVEVLEINTHSDIDRCLSFIAYPSSPAQPACRSPASFEQSKPVRGRRMKCSVV